MVLVLSLGLAACGNSDSNNTEPAMDQAAETVEIAETVETGTVEEATQESPPVGFMRGAQETLDKAKKAAQAIQDAAEGTADQIGDETK